MIFVHLGAGAGDRDEGANFRCGFTEFIKKKYQNGSKIFAIDANPLNIEKLKICYKNFKNVEVINFAISSKNIEKLTLYYTEDDAPHYQVCSSDINHVKKHYPYSKIKKFDVKAISINKFFEKYVNCEIDYLSIDIEGLDYDVLMSIDFNKFSIKNISIEYLHLKKLEKKNVINFLSNQGYSYCGFGYDHNNFDYLFKKKKIIWNIMFSKILHLISAKHYKIFNYFLFDKEKIT